MENYNRIVVSRKKHEGCNNPSCEAGNCVPACDCSCHETTITYDCGCVEVRNPQFWESVREHSYCAHHDYESMMDEVFTAPVAAPQWEQKEER